MNSPRENLIRRITKECEDNEVKVSKDFVSFLLTLISELNPASMTDSEEKDSTGGSRDAARRVAEKLLDETKPSLTTLKMQHYFAKHYTNREETVRKHRLELKEKIGPLVAEICLSRRLNDVNHRDDDKEERNKQEKLYQKILVVITLLSGLGNPTIAPVLREVALALQSVFQPNQLDNFVALPRREKEKRLMELASIVAGIRIFNRDCERGGEGIDDLPRILQDSVVKSREALVRELEDLMKRVYRLTRAVEKTIGKSNSSSDGLTSPAEASDTDNEFDRWAVELLTASRQKEIYIRKLVGDLEICENEIDSLLERFEGRLFKLDDTVRYRTAIPAPEVYPQFIDLADVWMRLQDQVILQSHINNLSWQLRLLCTKNVDVYNESKLDEILANDSEILTDAERLERSMGQLIINGGEKCTIHHPNCSKDFQRMNLEFLGFCATSLVTGEGSLIPGNPNIGVVEFRGKYFAFSSVEAASKFVQDPDRFTYGALDLVRRHCEYVHFFQLYDDAKSMLKHRKERVTERASGSSSIVIHRDEGIQTDLHLLPSNRDKDYSHSLWDYRKRALGLVDIF